MKRFMEKILNLDGVKGVWFVKGEDIYEKMAFPLDVETSKHLKRTFSRIFWLLQERNIKKEVGAAFDRDYLLFKPVEEGWFIIWIKREISLALTRMEIEVILDEITKKRGFFEKLKFW